MDELYRIAVFFVLGFAICAYITHTMNKREGRANVFEVDSSLLVGFLTMVAAMVVSLLLGLMLPQHYEEAITLQPRSYTVRDRWQVGRRTVEARQCGRIGTSRVLCPLPSRPIAVAWKTAGFLSGHSVINEVDAATPELRVLFCDTRYRQGLVLAHFASGRSAVAHDGKSDAVSATSSVCPPAPACRSWHARVTSPVRIGGGHNAADRVEELVHFNSP
jgi:hypothetical protein